MNFAKIPHPHPPPRPPIRRRRAQGWADEFADVPDQWAREFEEMRRDGDWAHENVWDQIAAEGAAVASKRRAFALPVSSIPTRIWAEGRVRGWKDLFRRGGVVRGGARARGGGPRRRKLVEAWRLLGTVHAENDDDRRRHRRDDARQRGGPEQPRGAPLPGRQPHQRAGPGGSDRIHAALVTRIDEVRRARGGTRGVDGRRAWIPPRLCSTLQARRVRRAEDADVHAVLGVLAHSRSYDEAIDAFNTALDINPQDYSLWNKLGATQANSARSADAMRGVSRALRPQNPITCARGPHGHRVRQPGKIRGERGVLRARAGTQPEGGERVGVPADFARVLREGRPHGGGGRQEPGRAAAEFPL